MGPTRRPGVAIWPVGAPLVSLLAFLGPVPTPFCGTAPVASLECVRPCLVARAPPRHALLARRRPSATPAHFGATTGPQAVGWRTLLGATIASKAYRGTLG